MTHDPDAPRVHAEVDSSSRPGLTIREATVEDGAACAALYAHYVKNTAISFETEPPSSEEMAERVSRARQRHAWFVAEDDGQVVGYAYGGPFAVRAAYRWACETSVYVALERRGMGAGRLLYEALLPRLAQRGFHVAVAGMTLPNEASEALHRAMGFEPVGTYRRIGWKLGAWHDVAWMQRPLAAPEGQPPEPV